MYTFRQVITPAEVRLCLAIGPRLVVAWSMPADIKQWPKGRSKRRLN